MESNDTTVGDYVTLQRGKTYKGDLVGKPGPALLGLGSITPGGGFRESDYKTYGGDCPPQLTLYPGDLFVSLKGATKDGKMIGSVARVPRSVPQGRLTQDTCKLQFTLPSKEVSDFMYWVLRTPHYRDYCEGRATGSAVVALSRDDFLSYPVPPLTDARQRLVRLFEAIEAKIRNNTLLNATLEAMSRAIFKSWFVDFDPVRQKAAGKQPVGMDAKTAALFPNSFEDSEIGEVPLGWGVGAVCDYANLNPESWSKATYPDEVRYVDLSATKWGEVEAVEKHGRESAPSRAQRILRSGDTIFGTVRPGNGSFAMVEEDGLTGSTGFAVLRPKHRKHQEYVYLATTVAENVDRLAHLADGGAYPAVRPEVVADTPLVAAPCAVVEEFSDRTCACFDRVAENRRESRTLATLRDTLLPKLLSGELRVLEAEQAVEEATA